MSCAAVFLALAMLCAGDPVRVRIRSAGLAVPDSGDRRLAAKRSSDPLAIASSLDMLAACLSAGMPVSSAAAATAPAAPPMLARVLNRAAGLLALGADPAIAWANPAPPQDHMVESLFRLARRSASSGTAMAHGVSELAVQCRHDAADAARAAAERASVLIAGPLGVCYLPAFLCLGVVPVVAGLAGDVLGTGLI